MAEDDGADGGGAVLQRLNVIDGKLNQIGGKLDQVKKEQTETSNRILEVKQSQAAINKTISGMRSAISSVDRRMTDVTRTVDQLRADFGTFRQQIDLQLSSLAVQVQGVGQNVVRVLEVVEKEELRRRQLLALRNIVQDAYDVLNRLDDNVVRHMASIQLHAMFQKHPLTVRSFDELPDRIFFQRVEEAISHAIRDVTEAETREITEYKQAIDSIAWAEYQLSEIDKQEAKVNQDNENDLRRAEEFEQNAENLRTNADMLLSRARQRGQIAWVVTGALVILFAVLGRFGIQNSDLSLFALFIIAAAVISGMYGYRKMQYSPSNQVQRLLNDAQTLRRQVSDRSAQYIALLNTVYNHVLGRGIVVKNAEIENIRDALRQSRTSAQSVRDQFTRAHGGLEVNLACS